MISGPISPRKAFFRAGIKPIVIAVLLGIVGAIIWGLCAPRTQVTLVDSEHATFDYLAGAAVGADMVFALVSLVCAVILVVATFIKGGHELLAVWFGILIGSFSGAMVCYILGAWIGNLRVATPKDLVVGGTTVTELGIGALGVLFVWPFIAMLLVSIVAWKKGKQLPVAMNELPKNEPSNLVTNKSEQ